MLSRPLLDRVAFLGISWYAVLIVGAMVIDYFLASNEARRLRLPTLCQFLARRRLIHHHFQRRRQRVDIVRREGQRGVAGHLAHAGRLAAHHRRPACHRL